MKNEAISKGLKNIRYTFIAQMIVMGAGVLKTLLIPSFLSVEAYGYWQIYLFYISYIGFFYLGFNDGVLLRYGKYDYEKLPFSVMRTSMYFYLVMLLIFSVVFSLYTSTIQDIDKRIIMSIIAASIVMYGINGVLVYIFLITNQIKLYSFFTSIDQVVVLFSAIYMLMIGNPNYKILIVVSFISKLVLVLVMMYLCKELFWGKLESIANGFREFTKNIECGLVLMLAQIMSMLLTGLGRVLVEYLGNIEEYAYYAFAMSVINIVMVCVTAFATVMYPMMSRVNSDDLPGYFNVFCSYVTIFNAMAVISYFPAEFFVKILFPQYSPMLDYLFVLFILLTWQAKINIVTNAYFRVLRKERQMFGINACGVLIFILIGFPAMFITHSIKAVAICTFFTILLIEIISEMYLRRQLGIRMSLVTVKDIVINIFFIICCITFNLLWGFVIYIIFLIGFLLLNKKTLTELINKIK